MARRSHPEPAAASDLPRAQHSYLVAPGHYVSFLAGGTAPASSFELLEVVSIDLGGPPAHRNPRRTSFHVLEGRLQMFKEEGEWLEPSAIVLPGQTYVVPAGVAHAAHNRGPGPVRFLVGGLPGVIDSYLAQFDAANV
jgi:mannose-6-phosphate isomerase-like protein (cupin superfamily)